MSKNVIINGREYRTRETYGGVVVEDFIEQGTLFFLDDLGRAGITVEEVKPKFEDLPPGYYASPSPDWGNSAVFSKSTAGNWYSTASFGPPEERARAWFEQGKLKPLAWAEDAE